MSSKQLHNMFRIQLLTLLGFVTLMPPAFAVDYWLWTGTVNITMPDGASVPMWGYALEPDNDFTTLNGSVTVPGPVLTIPPGDGTLTIHLRNNGLPEPVSIVIPGQIADMEPFKLPDTHVPPRNRVHSFTAQTAPNSEHIYTWTNLKPGTYLYHSGTHPQIQVQMGLYGGIKHDAVAATGSTPAEAYTGVPFDAEAMLLYSEIDPALHTAVAGGTYGTPAYPSTINYAPKYFLVNGKSHEAGDPALPAGAVGQRTLIRFLNAGLQTHVPVLQGPDMQIVAEDGNLYPYVRTQYSVFLPAGKTKDAIFTPLAVAGLLSVKYPIYDRKLALSNGAQPDGGMLAYLEATGGGNAPTISSSPVTTAAQGVLYSYQVDASDIDGGVLNYSLDSAPLGMAISASGLIEWTPTNAQAGTAPAVVVRVTDPAGLFATQPFTVTVANANHPPVAQNDGYSMIEGATLNVAAPGLLGNDSDPDAGGTLTAVNFSAASNGTVTGVANGGFSYTPSANFTGAATFNYQAQDNSGAANNTSNAATVSITVNPNQAPIAVNDTANAPMRRSSPPYRPVVISILSNDSDPDGTIAANTVTIVTQPNKGGTVVVNANGTVNYTPKLNFKGTDVFSYKVRDNLNKLSNMATVRVNVTR